MTDITTLPDTGGLPIDLFQFLKQRHNITTVVASAVMIASRMQSYISKMASNCHIKFAKDGGTNQRELYHTYLQALEAGQGEYIICLSVILFYIHKEAGTTFTDRLMFRFIKDSNMSQLQQECFCNLCTLFRHTANPVTRQVKLSALQLDKYVAHLPNEQSKQRLLSYFDTVR